VLRARRRTLCLIIVRFAPPSISTVLGRFFSHSGEARRAAPRSINGAFFGYPPHISREEVPRKRLSLLNACRHQTSGIIGEAFGNRNNESMYKRARVAQHRRVWADCLFGCSRGI